MVSAADERCEVWLRGNLRPVLGIALVVAAVLAAVAAVVLRADPSPLGWGMVAALTACSGVVVGGCLAIAARPRLVRLGSVVRVCLAPLSAHDLPLEIIECVFSGSASLAGDAAGSPEDEPADEGPGRRVGTVVMRLAERATAWRERPTLASWGRWRDGYIVFDGRWCEPLSPEFVRGLSQRLVEAKRELVAGEAPNRPSGCEAETS
jgi:hypothetical protein